METWKLLLITLLSAVVVGCIIGVLTGKHQIKKARGDFKPLLNVKERIIYSLCIVVGAACILFGVFVVPGLGGSANVMLDEFGNPIMDGDMYGGDAMFDEVDDAMMQAGFDGGLAEDDETAGGDTSDGITVEGDDTIDPDADSDDEEQAGEGDEDSEDELDSTDTQAAAGTGGATPAARPSSGGSVRRSGGSTEVVEYVIIG